MAGQTQQKARILYLLKILWEETDEDHSLTLKEIGDRLAAYGVSAERKSLYGDMEILEKFGVDVVRVKDRHTRYHLGNRILEQPELKLLADAVQCSNFITRKKTEELIRKLGKLSSVPMAQRLAGQLSLTNWVKTTNEFIYYTTDLVSRAISENRRIRFRYSQWQVNFRRGGGVEKGYRRRGVYYSVSPMALTWSDGNYYLIAYHEADGIKKHFRVDKISGAEMLAEPRQGLEEAFDVASYCRRHFHMFGGDPEEVQIIFANQLIGVVADRFGSKIKISPVDRDHFAACLPVEVSPTFLAWVLSFGKQARLVSPPHVVEKLRRHLIQLNELYGSYQD
jgi:hypothetical protein